MQIVYRSVNELIPYANNPRDNRNAVDAVAASIQAFGFKVPIVIDKDLVIVAGHTRLLAAKKLGIKEVPTIMADDLDDDSIRAYRVVDNRVAEMAVWDEDLLTQNLEQIGDTFDMVQFGFVEEETKVQTDNSKQLDLDDFADDAFEYECPDCGFRFQEE